MRGDIAAFVAVASSYQFCTDDCRWGNGSSDGIVYVTVKYGDQFNRFRIADNRTGDFIVCDIGDTGKEINEKS